MNNKFEELRPWVRDILLCIKKDIKTDYLPGDRVFYKKYFGNRPQNRLGTDEIFAAFEKELLEGNQPLEEWVVNHWVFQHGDLYTHFAERLSEIRSDFNELELLSVEESEKILAGSEAFDPITVYLFSKLNGVVFPSAIFDELQKKALEAKKREEEAKASDLKQENLEQILERQQREIARMEEKYESKVAGILRKYQTDTEALKKQIRSLQKQLQG